MLRRFLPYTLLVGLLLPGSASVLAQIPGITSSSATTPAAQPAAQPDPLGRENPRGAVLGFIKAAQDDKFALAAEYFEPARSRKHAAENDEEELASQLLAILNQRFGGPLDFLSRDPQGRLDDGLPPDQELLSNAVGSDPLPILMVRREDDQGRKLWYFSRQTLEKVPAAYDALSFPEMEKHIPEYLVQHRLLAMPYWQWLAILLCMPVVLVVGRLVSLTFEYALRYSRKVRHVPLGPIEPLRRIGPLTFIIALLLHYTWVAYIGTSLLYRLYYRRIIWICIAFGFYWMLTRLTRALATRLGASLSSRGLYAERSIVSLLRRFVEVTIFVFVLLVVLRGLGFDVSTALAGLGIGTLALGLGAQKTFENMFGGVSVLFDKVIQVGDNVKVNGQVGVVEDIGLRSTRLRTPERTVLSVPNGTMATAVLENLRFRDKFLCQQIIRLRYELSPDHVRYVLEKIRQIMQENSRIEGSSARVRFLRFSDNSLDVEIFCYILEADFNVFLEAQEALLLSIMDELEQAGAVLALPSQTTYVTQDAWVNPEKAQAAKKAMEKMRDPGVPGASSQLPST
ncbi:MAG TPA: mechanosensitive ion channel family protein [Dongiaceae bacterium]|nr:mechanosensitive ion channel family protein [Dongiaceae bacterium]